MLLVRLELRKGFHFHLLYAPAQLPVADALLVHLPDYPFGTFRKVIHAWFFRRAFRILPGEDRLCRLQHRVNPGLQFRLVLLDAAFPNKGVLVRHGLYLRPVYVLDLQESHM